MMFDGVPFWRSFDFTVRPQGFDTAISECVSPASHSAAEPPIRLEPPRPSRYCAAAWTRHMT